MTLLEFAESLRGTNHYPGVDLFEAGYPSAVGPGVVKLGRHAGCSWAWQRHLAGRAAFEWNGHHLPAAPPQQSTACPECGRLAACFDRLILNVYGRRASLIGCPDCGMFYRDHPSPIT